MAQVSSKFRRMQNGYGHWCPACEEIHHLPDSWIFDGNLESPTFQPSFKHEGMLTEKVDGKWTGNWVRDGSGNTIPFVCHYNLMAGNLIFHGDCTHGFAGRVVPLPELPQHLTDPE